MDSRKRVTLDKKIRRNSIIKLALIATVSVVGVLMAVVCLIDRTPVFALLYLIAAVLGVMYSVMQINATLPPSVEFDEHTLYLNTWDNCFFPFRVGFRPAFLADFVPAKTVTFELPIADICELAIGTKSYLSRMMQNEAIDIRLGEISRKSRHINEMLKRVDILYARLTNGEIYMMSVTDFDVDGLNDMVNAVMHGAHVSEFKTNMRLLRKKREIFEKI